MKLHFTNIFQFWGIRKFLVKPHLMPGPCSWFYADSNLVSGAVGGKTGKTSVLPGFSKIERGGGSDGAPHFYGGLTQHTAAGIKFAISMKPTTWIRHKFELAKQNWVRLSSKGSIILSDLLELGPHAPKLDHIVSDQVGFIWIDQSRIGKLEISS